MLEYQKLIVEYQRLIIKCSRFAIERSDRILIAEYFNRVDSRSDLMPI
jgi:hypothetical protein